MNNHAPEARDARIERRLRITEVVAAALSLVLGVWMLIAATLRPDIPDPAALQRVTGTVSWTESHRQGIRFRLTDGGAFDYPARAGDMALVKRALDSAAHRPVTIGFDARQMTGPIYSAARYATVWELHLGGAAIRSFDQAAAGWRSDNRLAAVTGAALLLGGLVLAADAIRIRRARRRVDVASIQ